jgi:hypothetical protein
MTNIPSSAASAKAPSHVYYFVTGAGVWRGTFAFRVTSWRELRGRRIGLVNGSLVRAMHLTQRLIGKSRLDSIITAKPDEGAFGVAENVVKLSKLGLTLYLLRERYVLNRDGTRVTVEAVERFGPLPGVLTRSFTYPAEIRDGGEASTYHMPLLGDHWTATYHVGDGGRQLVGSLVCTWAAAAEDAWRL